MQRTISEFCDEPLRDASALMKALASLGRRTFICVGAITTISEPPWSILEPRWFIEVNTTVVHKWPMSREDPQLKLRIPAILKTQIEWEANLNRRSLNAEILARIERINEAPSPYLRSVLEDLNRLASCLETKDALINALLKYLDTMENPKDYGSGFSESLRDEIDVLVEADRHNRPAPMKR